ncbi:hypothetical protein IPZ64_06680 [Streptomyces violaceoruber]|nr:hypothetical protein [Streptomyces violaceoruber]MCF3166603.1 hypothetical protein [Streptomyces violaceoruber]
MGSGSFDPVLVEAGQCIFLGHGGDGSLGEAHPVDQHVHQVCGRNGGTFYLTDLVIYADGLIDCWGLATIDEFVHERPASGDRGRWATHQLFSNVPLDDAGARELWRREAEGLESGGGGCSISRSVGERLSMRVMSLPELRGRSRTGRALLEMLSAPWCRPSRPTMFF